MIERSLRRRRPRAPSTQALCHRRRVVGRTRRRARTCTPLAACRIGGRGVINSQEGVSAPGDHPQVRPAARAVAHCDGAHAAAPRDHLWRRACRRRACRLQSRAAARGGRPALSAQRRGLGERGRQELARLTFVAAQDRSPYGACAKRSAHARGSRRSACDRRVSGRRRPSRWFAHGSPKTR